MNASLVSVEAWNGPDGWTWNNSFEICEVSPETLRQIFPAKRNGHAYESRCLFSWLRSEGYLSAESAGRVRLDIAGGDPDHYEVQDRHSGEPLLCLIVPSEAWESVVSP